VQRHSRLALNKSTSENQLINAHDTLLLNDTGKR
jgi:hypothetical protein